MSRRTGYPGSLQVKTRLSSSPGQTTSSPICRDIRQISIPRRTASFVPKIMEMTILLWSVIRSVFFSHLSLPSSVPRPSHLPLIQCDSPYHLGCLIPALDAIPDGEWFCPRCLLEPGAPIGPEDIPAPPQPKGPKPKKPSPIYRDDDEEDDYNIKDDDSDDEPSYRGQKRKGTGGAASGSAKRKR